MRLLISRYVFSYKLFYVPVLVSNLRQFLHNVGVGVSVEPAHNLNGVCFVVFLRGAKLRVF